MNRRRRVRYGNIQPKRWHLIFGWGVLPVGSVLGLMALENTLMSLGMWGVVLFVAAVSGFAIYLAMQTTSS
jgi:hypothetical protein